MSLRQSQNTPATQSSLGAIVCVSVFAVTSVVTHNAALADNSTDATPVKLVYDWPADLVANVEMSKTKQRTGGRGDSSVSGSFTMKTTAHDAGLQVDISDSTINMQVAEGSTPPQLIRMMERISELAPSYVISHEGELLSFSDIKKYQAIMSQEFDALMSDLPQEAKQQMTGFMDQLISEEALFASLKQDWDRDVGQWAGTEFEKGFIYEVNYLTPVPMLGGVELDTYGVYEILGHVACDKEPGAALEAANPDTAACVELHFSSRLEPEATEKMLGQLFESLGQPLPEDFRMEIDYELHLVTEPDTLLAHGIKEQKVVTATQQPGTAPIVQTEVTTQKIVYQ